MTAASKKGSPKPNRIWFDTQLAAQGLSQRRLARMLRVDAGAISKTLRGLRDLQVEEAVELAKIFSVPLEEVYRNMLGASATRGLETPAEALKIEGWVGEDLSIHEGAPRGPRNAPALPSGGRGVRVVRFQVMGSQYDMMDGALAYYRPGNTVDADAVGRLCVVQIQGDPTPLLRQVRRGYHHGAFNLLGLFGQPLETDAALSSASPVLWLKF